MTTKPEPLTSTAPPHSARGPRFFFGVAAGLLVVAFAGGLLPRLHRRATLLADTQKAAEEHAQVRVVKPRHGGERAALVLPGSVEAIQEVPIYARASGYLQRRLVDIGDQVQAGQLLAVIDTPEIDQELAQAQATLGQTRAAVIQTRATEALARTTTARYDKIVQFSVVSVQESEEKRAAAAVAVANVTAAEAAVRSGEANLARLRDLKGFSRVTAPFAGRITLRTTDVGALITAGQGQPLYRLARIDPVRVFVHVPQIDAPSVAVGEQAHFEIRGLAGRTFTGKVTRTAGAVDVTTRTMLIEMQIANADGSLLPGMYGQVSLPPGRDSGALMIPASALVFNGQGTQVLTVDEHGLVHVRVVRIEVDYGTELAIADGLDSEQRVIVNPSDRMVEGTSVTVLASPSPTPKTATNAPSQH
jgi:RND family efflux transporter MFP subunit